MTKHRSYASWLLLPLVLLAAGAGAQTVPVDVEIGYRWNDIEGNEDLYRTQINDGEGFMIRSLSFFDTTRRSGLDLLRVTATDLGVGPASTLNVEAGLVDTYRLRLGYRKFNAFSALPNFANPLIAGGIVPGQHTFDRSRTMFDADLEVLTFGRFTPFVGFSRGAFKGPGTTTYFLGTDEFKLDSNLDEVEQEIRVGTTFNTGAVYGSITQGWRSVDSDERLTLFVPSGGNNSTPILGRDPSASKILRTGVTDTDTPFTNLYVAGQISPRGRVVGTFTKFSADAYASDVESATGSFLSFPIQRFFNGYSETVTSSASNETWRASIRAEATINPRFDVFAGYRTEHRDIGGTALINSLFTDAVTFGGVPGNFATTLAADSRFERDVETVEAGARVRVTGPVTLRLGISRSEIDTMMDPDVAEISVPGNQGGSFGRSVDSIDAALNYAAGMVSFTLGYRSDNADGIVMRTDYTDRSRVRARVGFTTPANRFRLGFTAEQSEQDTDMPETGYDAEATLASADAEYAPSGWLRLRGNYSVARVDSTIRTRRPETFALDTSVHEEDWTALELGAALTRNPLTFDASYAVFENEGSIPYMAHRYRARLFYQFLPTTAVGAEWGRDEYEEDDAPWWGRFEGNQYGIFFRYRH